MVLKAQQLPQAPWSFTGVTSQSTSVASSVRSSGPSRIGASLLANGSSFSVSICSANSSKVMPENWLTPKEDPLANSDAPILK